VSITGVAVEKLPSEKSAKIKTRQEALQTIFLFDWTFSTSQFLLILRKRDFFNSLRHYHQQSHSENSW
jgi:hypothetical protein